MKVLLSGGHLTPALAFIDFARQQKDVDVVFVGREFSRQKSRQPSMERAEVAKRDVRFLPLDSGKLEHENAWELLGQLGRFLLAIRRALRIINQEKPDIFLSFGGYLAVPVAIACAWKKIPIVTHEQTRVVGVANKIIGFLSEKIAVSYAETTAQFPKQKVVVTGNPVRPGVLTLASRPAWMPATPDVPLLYITGGSQGSQFINGLVKQILPEISKEWFVVHQSGRETLLSHPKRELEQAAQNLPVEQQARIVIKDWVEEKEVAWLLQHATMVISRAGANTVHEVALAAKPALFIPLPFARGDEQQKNAEAVVAAGSAVVVKQKDASPATILETLKQCQQNYSNITVAAKEYARSLSLDGDKQLFAVVESVARKPLKK